MGKRYAEKEEAGEAILTACKGMKSTDSLQIGSYRGFSVELTFDSFSKDFSAILKGAVSHKAVLGTDARGNITRMDNVLTNISARMERAGEKLTDLVSQAGTAKVNWGNQFPSRKRSLQNESARLAEWILC